MDGFRYAQVMGQIVGQPLCIHPRAGLILYNALCGRFGTAPAEVPATPDAQVIDARQLHIPEGASVTVTPKASRFEGQDVAASDDRYGREPFRMTPGGVAIVTLTGETANRGFYIGKQPSGDVTSYEGLRYQFLRAGRHPKVKSIIFDQETPGGQAIGAFELSALLRAISAEKPIYTIANGLSASAGYMLASGSRRIIASPSSVLGSIGVMMIHLDHSKKIEGMGVVPTIITAGDHKADGNPLEPLSESALESLQGRVNSFYRMFLETVSVGRGRRMSAKAARETEARTYIGQEAVDVGLADAVGSFDDVLSEAESIARRGNVSRSTGAKAMSVLTDPQAGVPENEVTARVAAARAEGVAEGRAQGEAEALARINTIASDSRAAGRVPLAIDLAVKSPSMSAADVLDFVAKIPVVADPVPEAVIKPLAGRAAETNVNAVLPGAGQTTEQAKEQQIASSWSDQAKTQNTRFASRGR